MELEADILVSPATEVPVIDGDIVTAIRDLASREVGSKSIAKQLGIARNTVRRYRREPVTVGVQVRPARGSCRTPTERPRPSASAAAAMRWSCNGWTYVMPNGTPSVAHIELARAK